MRILFHILLSVLLLLSAIGPAGCVPQFAQPQHRALPTSLSDKHTWKISAKGDTFKHLRWAIDQNLLTVAETSRNYRQASVTIDLTRPCLFNLVMIVHGDKEFGFARRVSIATSNDGRNFTHRYTASGTRQVTYLPLLEPVSARYIRITAVQPGTRPWALAEIVIQ